MLIPEDGDKHATHRYVPGRSWEKFTEFGEFKSTFTNIKATRGMGGPD